MMSDFKLCAFALTLILNSLFCAGAAETKPPEKAQLDTKAVAVLRSAIEYLGKAQTYSTTLLHKKVLDGGPGKTTETSSKYEISVERPNKLALVIKDGKLRCTVISDGNTLCTYSPEKNYFAQHEAPKTLNDLFEIPEMELIQEDLDRLLLLDQFSATDALDVLMEGAQSVKLLGVETLGGTKAYRIHFALEQFPDWDLWIQEGNQPLVLKISQEGEQKKNGASVKVTVTTQFDDWKINVPIPKERFSFSPPQNAKKVAELVKHPPNPMLLVGQPAPSVKLKLLDGTVVDLASFKGKNVVILDFWATWCGPCRMAMPVISEVTAAYKDKGLIAFAVNLGEDLEKLQAFKKATPALTMPILMDEDTKTAEAYLIVSIPMTVIIGKDGVIQRIHKDVPRDMDVLRKRLKDEFDTVLGGGSLLTPPPKEGAKEPAAK